MKDFDYIFKWKIPVISSKIAASFSYTQTFINTRNSQADYKNYNRTSQNAHKKNESWTRKEAYTKNCETYNTMREQTTKTLQRLIGLFTEIELLGVELQIL